MLTRNVGQRREDRPVEPLRDPVLRGAVIDVIGRVDRVLGMSSGGSARSIIGDSRAVRAELAVRMVRLAEELRRPPSRDRWATTHDQLVDLLLDVRSLAERVEDESDGRWAAAFERLGGAVAIVRRVGSLEELLAEAPAAVIGLGFGRTILSAVRDGAIVPEHCLDLADPERAAAIVQVGSDRPVLLDRSLRETDMVRTRAAILVADAQNDPRRHRGLLRAAGWCSFVAAPVTVRERVVGFVHADRGDVPVGPVDVEVLRLLCEAFGMAFERFGAENRTARARMRVRRALTAMEAAFEPGGGNQERVAHDPRPEVEALLTSREVEVLRLMAAGATNAAIAATLVIAEGTAKTHVKNILRKLEAGNRAEAVSRFLGGMGDDDDPD